MELLLYLFYKYGTESNSSHTDAMYNGKTGAK